MTNFTDEEIRKAIDKYQKEHRPYFGAMLDVTTISSKEGADIIAQTIERVNEKVEEDTELWCICEMAKMYMQGVRPVYPVSPSSRKALSMRRDLTDFLSFLYSRQNYNDGDGWSMSDLIYLAYEYCEGLNDDKN